MSKPAPKPAAAKSPPVTAARPRTATASSAAARSKSAVRKPEEKKAAAPAKAGGPSPAAPSSARRLVKAAPSYEQSFVKAKTGTAVTAAPAAAGRPATVSRSGSSRLVKAPSRSGSTASLTRTGSASSVKAAAPSSSADVYGASGRDPESDAPVPVRSESSRSLPRKNSGASAQPVQPAAPEEDEPQLPSKSPRPILKTCAVIACFNHRDLKESPYCAEHREQKEREAKGERRASKASVTSVEEPPPVPPPDEEERQPQPEDNMQSAEPDSDLVCAFCNEHFAPGTSYITALGATYHADHFRCTQCHKVLADSDAPVYSFEGKPYCEPDYLSKFAKKCSRCGKEIIGKFFRALDKDWHESCLKCNKCSVSLVGKPIYHKSTADPNAQYHEGDELYCEEDYQALYGENCAACGKLLVGKILKALDDKWHPECFCCAECQDPLGGSFFVENNNVYCRKDFENLFATRCAGCNEIVSGPCLKALDKTFHRECFVCSHCKAPLQTDKFYQEGADVYCLKDYEQLYAIHCAGCNGLVTGTVLHVLDKDWHKECFCCSECKTPLAEGFLKKDEKVFCNPCYSRLFDINCAGCGDVLSGPYVEVLGFTWHRDCFLCTTCLKPIQGDACFVQDNRVYCSDDFKALLLATGQGGDLDAASSFTDLSAQNTPNVPREKVDYNKFSKDLEDNSGKGKPAKFGRMAKIPSKARLQMRFSELPAIPEETIRRKEPAEFDLGICLARGIDATLSSGKKRIFRSDFKDKSLYKPDTEAGLFDFQDYAPCVFQALRQLYGIANESYREALCAKGNLLGGRLAGNTPAQSAPFFFSRDKRFLIRSISQEEVEFMTKIFDKYFRHVTRHPHTLLPRLFGLYEVKLPKQKSVRFIVMNNIFDTPLPISQKFDFKGSQSGRFVDETEIKAMQAAGGPGFVPVLKDQNFKSKIFLHPDDSATLKQQLGRDCSFLKACDIINHSLLVGIHKGNAVPQSMLPPSPPTALMKGLVVSYGGRERGLVSLFQQDDGGIRAFEDRHPERRRDVYFFGIIDILQEASSKRNIRFNRSAVAAMEAKKYNLQFEKFIRELLAA